MKHTPAPWIVEAEEHGILVTSQTPGLCASVTVPGRKVTAEDRANARLISAAPDLLAALQGLQDAIDKKMEYLNPGRQTENWLSPILEEAIPVARAAIAKATEAANA